MNISKKLELAGLLALSAASLVMVGVATESRTGNAEPARATSLITEANASPVATPSPDGHPKKPGEAQTPIYLDLGAKY